ncbi:hypothetical protein D6774_02775 [Candidatus Woesearchaeota archaeon]|nr:MAG: hypothetical protein D6774_02775 [Candidatus Woesearchaeota archaeon]
MDTKFIGKIIRVDDHSLMPYHLWAFSTIFGVENPLLEGESVSKAQRRLQLNIAFWYETEGESKGIEGLAQKLYGFLEGMENKPDLSRKSILKKDLIREVLLKNPQYEQHMKWYREGYDAAREAHLRITPEFPL